MLNEGLHPKEDINLRLPVAIFPSFREGLPEQLGRVERWGKRGGRGRGERKIDEIILTFWIQLLNLSRGYLS